MLDFCAYGTPWRKPTAVVAWRFAEAEYLSARCGARQANGWACTFTGEKHVTLEGRHPNGKLMTQVAEPYPAALCEKYAVLAANRESCLLDHLTGPPYRKRFPWNSHTPLPVQ